MNRVWRRLGGLSLLFVGLIVLYTLLMLAAYTFPDAWIESRVSGATAILSEEGNMIGGYGTYFWHSGFGITDNLTDIRIYEGLLRDGRSVADAAMRTDYIRYWHGYAVLLRPLSIALNIIHIRYLNMMLVLGLLLLCYWHCRKRFGACAAAAFSAALLMSFILIAPFCQQYMPVYAMALLGCYLALARWRAIRERLPEFFLILGSLTCFFDFLTFPVLALGYPLLCCLLARLEENGGGRSLWGETIALSAAWMAGYALTWLGKGAVGTLLTGLNAFSDILSSVAQRTTGAFVADAHAIEISPLVTIRINLETFFIAPNAALFLLALAAVAVYALVSRAPARAWLRALPVAAVALYPFLWYCVLQNHGRVHFWMTYKQLSVTVFSLWAYFIIVARQKPARTRPAHL